MSSGSLSTGDKHVLSDGTTNNLPSGEGHLLSDGVHSESSQSVSQSASHTSPERVDNSVSLSGDNHKNPIHNKSIWGARCSRIAHSLWLPWIVCVLLIIVFFGYYFHNQKHDKYHGYEVVPVSTRDIMSEYQHQFDRMRKYEKMLQDMSTFSHKYHEPSRYEDVSVGSGTRHFSSSVSLDGSVFRGHVVSDSQQKLDHIMSRLEQLGVSVQRTDDMISFSGHKNVFADVAQIIQ